MRGRGEGEGKQWGEKRTLEPARRDRRGLPLLGGCAWFEERAIDLEYEGLRQ